MKKNTMYKRSIFLLTLTLVTAVITLKAADASLQDYSSKFPVQSYEMLKKKLGYDPNVRVFVQQINNRTSDNTITTYHHEQNVFGPIASNKNSLCPVITGFHHGLGDEGNAAIDHYAQSLYMLGIGYTFNFADCLKRGEINLTKLNLGEKDAKDAEEILRYINALYAPEKIVLWGNSRGGGVVTYLLGKKEKEKYTYLDEEIQKKIACAILNAPLANLQESLKKIINTQLNKANFMPKKIRDTWAYYQSCWKGYWIYEKLKYFLGPCKSYINALIGFSVTSSVYAFVHVAGLVLPHRKFNERNPVDYANNINCPIFMVTTESDALVPCKSSEEIIQQCGIAQQYKDKKIDEETCRKQLFFHKTEDGRHLNAFNENDFLRACLYQFLIHNGVYSLKDIHTQIGYPEGCLSELLEQASKNNNQIIDILVKK